MKDYIYWNIIIITTWISLWRICQSCPQIHMFTCSPGEHLNPTLARTHTQAQSKNSTGWNIQDMCGELSEHYFGNKLNP